MIARIVVAACLACAAASAGAETYTWFDFSDTVGLQLNGDAAIVGHKTLRLTQSASDEAGSLFTSFGVGASGFHAAFAFQIKKPGGTAKDCRGQVGGEGLAFVLQGTAPTSLGEDGGGMGYEGIPDSIAIEFDTFCNGDHRDRSSNHIALVANGIQLASASVTRPMDDGEMRYAWLDYDGTVLEVRLDKSERRPRDPDLSFAVDIPGMVGGPVCCAGFTAATGTDATAEHLVYSWQYADDSPGNPPGNPPGIPPANPPGNPPPKPPKNPGAPPGVERTQFVQPICRGRVGTSVLGR